MREIPYGVFEEIEIPALRNVREFHNWRAHIGGLDEYLIVIDDFEQHRAVVFKYKNRADRDVDVDLILRLPDDGESGAGVPAWLSPTPPSWTESAAEPLPNRPNG